MGEKRRNYTKEFEIEAVHSIIKEGNLIVEVARVLGAGQRLLHRCTKKS
jgi:transposase-like protein